MKKRTHKTARLLGVLVLLALQTACVAPPMLWLSQSGQVLEWPSKKPIEGVLVVKLWRGSRWAIVHSSSNCFHVETAITDSEGRFKIPLWFAGPKFETNQRSYISAFYKTGYKASTYTKKNPGGYRKVKVYYREDREKGLYYLETKKRPASEELKKISESMHSMSCGSLQNRRSNYLAYKKLYNLARPLAITREDKMVLKGIRAKIVRVWRDSPNSISLDKSEEYFEKHLKEKFQ